jgi:hypothetical protein
MSGVLADRCTGTLRLHGGRRWSALVLFQLSPVGGMLRMFSVRKLMFSVRKLIACGALSWKRHSPNSVIRQMFYRKE